MVYESVIEESIISLLQNKGYELIDENDNWILNHTLDEFINEDLLKECFIKINKISDMNIIKDGINADIFNLKEISNFIYKDEYDKKDREKNSKNYTTIEFVFVLCCSSKQEPEYLLNDGTLVFKNTDNNYYRGENNYNYSLFHLFIEMKILKQKEINIILKLKNITV